MQKTGIVRKINSDKQIKIPSNLLFKLGWNTNDTLEFKINDNNELVLENYSLKNKEVE